MGVRRVGTSGGGRAPAPRPGARPPRPDSAGGWSGRPKVTARRGIRLSSWLGAASLVAGPAASTSVRAQPGFGPDPFWPYNSFYTPYTRPIGPASPAGGQGAPYLPRSG